MNKTFPYFFLKCKCVLISSEKLMQLRKIHQLSVFRKIQLRKIHQLSVLRKLQLRKIQQLNVLRQESNLSMLLRAFGCYGLCTVHRHESRNLYSKSANKLSTSCVRTVCYKSSTVFSHDTVMIEQYSYNIVSSALSHSCYVITLLDLLEVGTITL